MANAGSGFLRGCLLVLVAGGLVSCSGGKPRTPLDGAAASLGLARITGIEFSGTGRWYSFGQGVPLPAFEVSSYTAVMDYNTAAARVQMTRTRAEQPGRDLPPATPQGVDQYVAGNVAWNMPGPRPQPALVPERQAEIWSSPHGFVRAAQANRAATAPAEGGTQVTFAVDGRTYQGLLDANYQLVRVRTIIDNPVMGDMVIESQYSDYQKFGDISFPTRITRTMGGYPVLELTVNNVVPSAGGVPAPPRNMGEGRTGRVEVVSEELAPGVFYLKGGAHYSLAIDQADGIVVVEAPLHEERSLAVIAKVKELIPNKPITHVINTHIDFDHSGGLRTYVAEGATVVTHAANQSFFEQAWAAPRTLNPDRMSESGATAKFQTFTDKLVLADRTRPVEVHHIAGNPHDDAFAMIWLPRQRILIEGDAWTPPGEGAAPPTRANPFAVNLLENIDRLKLDVRQIAALHGRVGTIAELRSEVAAGK